MKTPRNIPIETIANQNKAADPKDSVWVSANAGSGKTHVLTERVIRLLLDGTDPSENSLPDLYQGSRRGDAKPRFCTIVRMGDHR